MDEEDLKQSTLDVNSATMDPLIFASCTYNGEVEGEIEDNETESDNLYQNGGDELQENGCGESFNASECDDCEGLEVTSTACDSTRPFQNNLGQNYNMGEEKHVVVSGKATKMSDGIGNLIALITDENTMLDELVGNDFRDKMYNCNHCGFGSNNRHSLAGHLSTHSGDKPLSCPYSPCLYRTKTKGCLRIHIARKHTLEKPLTCEYCNFRTATNGDLKRHVMIHTGERPYSCSLCDYKATQKTSLDMHVMLHTGEKPHCCTECDYKTSRKAHLTMHMAEHTGDKPLGCEYCSYRTFDHRRLRDHSIVHSEEKPFQCNECDYRTARKGQIKEHVRVVHERDKPFKCIHCSYKAPKKHNLMSHMRRVHPEGDVFSCDHCTFSSTDKIVFRDHMNVNHSEIRQFICDQCSFKTAQKYILSRHVKRMHSECS